LVDRILIKGAIKKYFEIWWVLLFIILIPVFLAISFPISDFYDLSDIIPESLLLISTFVAFILIIRYKIISLTLGVAIFLFAIYFDFLDDFINVSVFFSNRITNILMPTGLLILAFGFYKLAIKINQDVQKKEQAERIQSVLYKISDATSTTKDLDSLYSTIRKLLGEIIDTSNFYIALYDKKTNLLSFPYFIDTEDTYPKSEPLGKGLTAYILKTAEGSIFYDDDVKEMAEKGEIELLGSPAQVWMGCPLMIQNEPIGVVSVQSYDDETLYSEENLQVLEFVSDEISKAIVHKQAEEDLKDSNSMKEILLDVISHDLINPVGTLLGFSELLLEKNPESEELSAMKQSSENLLKVIDNANVLSKAVLGEEIDKKALDLTQILTTVIDEFEFRLKDTDIDLVKEIDESIQITANPIIEQVFTNYISNAIQYAGSGKKIIVRAKEENNFVTIEVEDYGSTISEEKRKLIFNRNIQLTKGQKRGRGLGLAIVKRIAEAHNAEVGIKPKTPNGNIFYIKLPK
jgi:signal transduction histidine kinase